MAYKLLGMAVWHGAKWYLARRYGPRLGTKALAVGGGVAAAAGLAALLLKRSGSGSGE
jgi:hypothetical protein